MTTEPISAAEPVLFWRGLKERWRDLIERLGNRVTAEDRKKALAAIHARIPKPDEFAERAARAAPLKRQADFWESERKKRADRLEKEREQHAVFTNMADPVLRLAQMRFVETMQGKPVTEAEIADGHKTILQYLAMNIGGPSALAVRAKILGISEEELAARDKAEAEGEARLRAELHGDNVVGRRKPRSDAGKRRGRQKRPAWLRRKEEREGRH
jgi:hypothetical protein